MKPPNFSEVFLGNNNFFFDFITFIFCVLRYKMGDADGMTHDDGDGMTHVYKMIHDEATHDDGDAMTHDDGDGVSHDNDAAAAEMFYNDNGSLESAHSNNSNSTNRMGMVNKTLL